MAVVLLLFWKADVSMNRQALNLSKKLINFACCDLQDEYYKQEMNAMIWYSFESILIFFLTSRLSPERAVSLQLELRHEPQVDASC